jgi:hypothetical protein
MRNTGCNEIPPFAPLTPNARFWLNVQMERPAQFKLIAPAIHAFLFMAMWALYAALHQGLSEGLSGVIFAILMIVDLPFSIIAFGVMFGGGRDGTIAMVAWGIRRHVMVVPARPLDRRMARQASQSGQMTHAGSVRSRQNPSFAGSGSLS